MNKPLSFHTGLKMENILSHQTGDSSQRPDSLRHSVAGGLRPVRHPVGFMCLQEHYDNTNSETYLESGQGWKWTHKSIWCLTFENHAVWTPNNELRNKTEAEEKDSTGRHCCRITCLCISRTGLLLHEPVLQRISRAPDLYAEMAAQNAKHNSDC